MPVVLYDLCGADEARRFSPYCWRVKMALAHKHLGVEERATPFTKIREMVGGVSSTVPVISDEDRTISDSWDIAVYLEETYPDRPSLFGGEGGRAAAKFVESWVNTTVHFALGNLVMKDIHDILGPDDQAYFRESREKRFGTTLESLHEGREARLDTFRKALQPVRQMLKNQPWFGGDAPLFADYILFGTLQWPRVVSSFRLLEDDDPVTEWFGRCLELHNHLGHKTPAAA
ncbi:glutathione S-transferase family protein [Breoghania sp. L-A4]|uniref:glutathione S-transferase family protein n=1 Tax=Breoghania sp. L-A4 TaxID=2304600 RepID=UPI000E3607D1|nr:glutathione S-transferase family protein [Breoghania sp. L-A4]AXS40612.1 glutathione S-transferase family protein [Breoghania sp. L-A4]